MVLCVGNEDVARAVDGQRGRLIHLGGAGGPAVSKVPVHAAPRGDLDPAGPGVEPEDAIVAGVTEVDVARGVDARRVCPRHARFHRGTRPEKEHVAVASERLDPAGREVEAPDAGVQRVGDHEPAVPVERDSSGPGERDLEGRPIAREPALPDPGDRRDDLRLRIDAPENVVRGVRDVQVALTVEGDLRGCLQRGRRGGAAVSREARPAAARERLERSRLLQDAPHAGSVALREDEIPLGIQDDVGDRVESKSDRGRRRDAAVAREPVGPVAGDRGDLLGGRGNRETESEEGGEPVSFHALIITGPATGHGRRRPRACGTTCADSSPPG